MASLADMFAAYRETYGIYLASTTRTGSLLIDEDKTRPYYCELIGPLRDVDDPHEDLRVFITHRVLGDTETLHLLVQDRDDDAWLNMLGSGTKRGVRSIWLNPDGSVRMFPTANEESTGRNE